MAVSAKKELTLEGLGCANCAAKIEQKVNDLAGVKSASVDFVSKRLVIEVFDEGEMPEILRNSSDIIVAIEPDIKVKIQNLAAATVADNGSDRIDILKIARTVSGLILFLIALLINFTEWVDFGLYLISYLLVGGEVVFKSR